MAQGNGVRRVCSCIAITLSFSGVVIAADWKFEASDGLSSMKLGFLAQARAESIENAAGETARDLYFRRLRLLFGGQLAPKWSFFFETDSPNLGRGESDGSKNASDIFIQDFVITYEHVDALKVDFGLILIPLSHNSQQSAASLLPSDYGPFSFLNSGATDSRVGRDYGVQVRGYAVGKSLEYRAGVYQGERGEDSTNDFRYAGRVVWYPLEPDTAFYYVGTTLGKKKILAIGGGLDVQEEYRAYSADVFFDHPVGTHHAITAQLARIHLDGDSFFSEVPEQDVTSLELGWYFARAKLQPYGAWYDRDVDDAASSDETQFEVGVAWYWEAYERVLKLGYGQLRKDGTADRDRLVLQLQIFHF